VVVARAREPQERCVGAWFVGDDLHLEQLGVEAQRPVEVCDEEHGVVEANR
jgi:hypothetical protein